MLVWINQKAKGINQVRNLMPKGLSIHAFNSKAKFWQGSKEDIEVGEVCRMELIYVGRVREL